MALSKKAQAKAAELTQDPVAVVEEIEEVSDNTSIFKKAGALGVPSTLVFGGFASGKSTLVKELVLEAGQNPLWLALNNDTALQDPRVSTWDVGSVGSWEEFNKNVYKPAIRGELKGYSAIVIDGGNVLMGMAVAKQAPNGQAERADWLIASNMLRDTLVKLRECFGKLYLIVDVVASNGTRKLDFNPYAYNSIVPLFGNKFYTNIVKERDSSNRLTGERAFTVQRDADLALSFVNGEKIVLDTSKS